MAFVIKERNSMDYAQRLYNALVDEHKEFFDYKNQKLKDEYAHYIDECPVCGSRKFKSHMTKDWFNFDKCSDCSMVFVNPRLNDKATYAFYNSAWIDVYNESKFYSDDANSYDSVDRKENLYLLNLLNKNNNNNNIKNTCPELVEIGPGGVGSLLKEAMNFGYKVTGVELGEENCNRLKNNLGDEAEIINSTLEDANLQENFYDYAAMRDVLEHIPNPKPFLQELNRILKPKAKVIIQIPNFDGLIYRVAGPHHTVVFPFEHPNYWSPKSIGKILNDTGFEIELIEHESADFSLLDINHYILGESSFTTCFKRKRAKFKRSLYKRLTPLLSSEKINKIDKKIMPFFADKICRKGSVIKVVAQKV